MATLNVIPKKDQTSEIFFEWINRRGSVVLTYPPFLDSASVIAMILAIPEMAGKHGFMMTCDPDNVSKMSMVELPKQLFLPYDVSPMLKNALGVSSYIIIDDLSLFRLADMAPHLKNRNAETRLIFLATLGVTDADLTYVRSLFPENESNLPRATLSFTHPFPSLDYRLEVCEMTPNQVYYYEEKRRNELNRISPESDHETKRTARNYTTSHPICNCIYPDDIQDQLEMAAEIQDLPADLDCSKGGWMAPSMIYSLGVYSPKFANLLINITLNKKSKHVVYSKYVDKYGLRFLSTLLDYMKIPHKLILTADGERQLEKFNKFNKKTTNETYVLLTDVTTLPDLKNVSHFHCLEGSDTLLTRSLLDRFYKINLYDRIPDKIIFYTYISRIEDSPTPTADESLYRDFSNTIIQLNDTFIDLVSHSQPLFMSPKYGLIISS